MFTKKDKTLNRRMFKFFESQEVIFDFVIKALSQIGWLSKTKFNKNDVNLVKIDSKTVHSKIVEFSISNIEFIISIKDIGEQTWSFGLEKSKRGCLLEISSKMDFSEKIPAKDMKNNLSIIKNAFWKNTGDIDRLIRDLLEEEGYSSFF